MLRGMSVLPDGKMAFLEFSRVRLTDWQAHTAALGVSPELVAAFAVTLERAREAQHQADVLRLSAEGAMQIADAEVASARAAAAEIVRLIKNHAVVEQDDKVYALGGLGVPRRPRRNSLPAPTTPRLLNPELNTDGSITIRWRVTQPVNARGTSYIVERQLPGRSDWEHLGIVGGKSFTDDQLPSGIPYASYRVQPRRGGVVGEASASLMVSFGRVGEGVEARAEARARVA